MLHLKGPKYGILSTKSEEEITHSDGMAQYLEEGHK